MAGTATVTGTVGPGRAITAQVFTDVSKFEIDTNTEMLYLTYGGGKRIEISIAAAATITCTVSGSTYTLTIAN